MSELIAEEFQARLVEMRRTIHRHPELGFGEHETSAFIAARLRELGLEVQTGVAQTGVVGLLRGKLDKPVLAIRADMDALPIQEQSGVEYASQNPGVMHACGHDANVTVALGTAEALSLQLEQLQGTVKFIFQPSEETPPGGAKQMVAEAVLEDPCVDAIVAGHMDPEVEIGQVATKVGPLYANADRFTIEIIGKGGHAAYPHYCLDPIWIAAQVVTALHQLTGRVLDPLEPAVITIGKISAGTTHNVIPDKALLQGTMRTLSDGAQKLLREKIEAVVHGLANMYGAQATFTFEPGYPCAGNEERLTHLVLDAVKDALGPENALYLPQPSMGGEDFAYFARCVPGCMFHVGIHNEAIGAVYPLHHSQFTMDERALGVGVAVMLAITQRFFKEWEE